MLKTKTTLFHAQGATILMKKIMTTILSTVLAASLAGCGVSQNAAPSSNSTGSGTSKSDGVTDKKPVTLKLWAAAQELPWDVEMRNEFQKLHPEIKLDVEPTPGKAEDYRKAYITALTAGEGPAVFKAPYGDLKEWVNSGFVADLTSYYNKMPDKDQFIEEAIKGASDSSGKVYGIPNFVYVLVLFYNKKIFADAGIAAPPKTWDELKQTAQKLTKRDNNQVGYALLGMDWCSWYFQDYLAQAGGSVVKDSKVTMDSKETVNALQLYHDLVFTQNATQKDVTGGSYDDLKNLFGSGKAAMFVAAPDSIPSYYEMGMKAEDIGIAPLPSGVAKSAGMGGDAFVMNPKLKQEEKDAAFEYIKFMTAKDTREKVWKMQFDQGKFIPEVPFRKDLDQSKVVKIPAEWATALSDAVKQGRFYDNYMGAAEVNSKVLTPMIQKVLVEKDINIADLVKTSSQQAQKIVDASSKK